MRVRISSDWHLELKGGHYLSLEEQIDRILPSSEKDKSSILILAGDIHYKHKVEEILAYLSPKFKAIVYCPGNHEFYHSSYCQLDFDIPNVYTDELILGDYVFITRTLFSDIIDSENIDLIINSLNDFSMIRGMSALAYQRIHNEHLVWLINKIKEHKGKKVVVCTHHAPSRKSINYKFLDSNINEAFYSNLDCLVEKVHLWVHGHMHDYCEYENVICNPFGYEGEESNYDLYKYLEV